jgi:hypothetical protein
VIDVRLGMPRKILRPALRFIHTTMHLAALMQKSRNLWI